MSTTKTIRRAKWHSETDRWQATDYDGRVYAYQYCPYLEKGSPKWWPSRGCGVLGPRRTRPADYTTTLRRISNARKP